MLTAKVIKQHFTGDRLVHNVDIEQRDRIEGAQYDLRVKAMYSMEGAGYIGCAKRITPGVRPLPMCQTDPPAWEIGPGRSVLVETVEEVEMPDDLVAIPGIRTTLFRCGLNLECTFVPPGYRGSLTFKLDNPHWRECVIEQSARIASLRFLRFTDIKLVEALVRGSWTQLLVMIPSSESDQYEGVWQGGRISTNGEVERPY